MASYQLKYFMVPAGGDPTAEDALNRFLRSHSVLQIRQKFVVTTGDPVWYIAVRYAVTSDAPGHSAPSERSGVDYKDELEPEAFARFVELRKRRKAIAETDGLPAFAVFTDKELAGIAELQAPELSSLKSVKGIGAKKLERFGARILTPLPEAEDRDATRGTTT